MPPTFHSKSFDEKQEKEMHFQSASFTQSTSKIQPGLIEKQETTVVFSLSHFLSLLIKLGGKQGNRVALSLHMISKRP